MRKKTIYISFCLLVLGTLFTCTKTETKVDCLAQTNPDCICTLEYKPVCGCDEITYSNVCAANCADIEIISQGECP